MRSALERHDELARRFEQEPFARTLGATLQVFHNGKAYLLVGSVPQHVCIVGGVAQGGYTTSLADYAGVYAAMTLLPEGHTPCKRISIDLLRPVACGENIIAFGEVVNESRTEILVQAKVYAAATPEKPKAVATLTFAKPRKEGT